MNNKTGGTNKDGGRAVCGDVMVSKEGVSQLKVRMLVFMLSMSPRVFTAWMLSSMETFIEDEL